MTSGPGKQRKANELHIESSILEYTQWANKVKTTFKQPSQVDSMLFQPYVRIFGSGDGAG